MTTENTAGAETAGSAATGETEATLDQMQASEATEAVAEPAKEPSEPTEKVKEEKVVPLAALHEERNARKELQRQLAESARKQAERDAIIDRRLAALTPKQAAPEKEVDPWGYLEHSTGQAVQQAVQTAVQPFVQAQQEQEQRQQQETYVRNLRTAVITSAAQMEKTTPDIVDAGNYVISQRTRELMVLGMPEHAAQAQATQDLDNLLMQWAHQQMNPAATAYEFAKARGYTPKAAQQQQQSPAEKIAAQQKGTAAARSLGGGGAPNAGKLTAEALANMSDEDFSKLTEAQFAQAMGG